MSFCEHCVDLKELPGTPAGSESKIGGVNTYVSKGSGGKGAVVIATDIFGLGITNPKIVADKLAKETGFSVYVPDIFPGGPIDPKDFVLPSKAADGAPGEDAMNANFANFGKWLEKGNKPDETYKRFKSVAEEVRKTDGGGKVGAIGYCYGGKVAVLAALDGNADAVVLYHPSLLEPDEADKVKTPVLLNEAELEPLFTGELQQTWHKVLKSNGLLDSHSKTYPNTVHGFGVRPDLNDAKVKAGYEESIEATVAFLKKNL